MGITFYKQIKTKKATVKKNIGIFWEFQMTPEEINYWALELQKSKKKYPNAENIEVMIKAGKLKIETTFEAIMPDY